MKKLYLLFLFCPFAGFSQTEEFVQKPSFPGTARDDAAVFTIGHYAYLGTGLQTGFTPTNDFYVYSFFNDTWEPIAPLPGAPRQYACAFARWGKGYVVGGIGAGNTRLNDMWRYTAATDTWDSLPPFPGAAREGMQTASDGGGDFVFFGRNESGMQKEVWRFNGYSETWTRLPDFPSTPRYLSGCAQYGNGVYFVSGYDSSGVLGNEVWRFDVVNQYWERLSDFPGEACWYGTCFGSGGYIYFGTGWNTTFLNTFWKLHVATDTWSPAPALPAQGRKGVCTFNLVSTPFIATGVTQDGERTQEVWQFDSNIPNMGVAALQEQTFRMYPNPATENVNLEFTDAKNPRQLCVTDLLDRQIYRAEISGNTATIDVSTWPDGIYTVTLSDLWSIGNQKICVRKH